MINAFETSGSSPTSTSNLIAAEHLDRQGRCWYCGTPIFDLRGLGWTENGSEWMLPEGFSPRVTEHQTPKCRGGSNSPGNKVQACASCNSRKGTKTLEEYRYRCSFGEDWSTVRNMIQDMNMLSAEYGSDSKLYALFHETIYEFEKHYVAAPFVFHGEVVTT